MDLRLTQELGGAEVEATVLIDLGIEPRVVRPGVQVAASEGECRGVEAESRHVARRHADAHRDLAQLREAGILDVAVVRSHQAGDVPRLLVERSALTVRRERIAEAHIAEAIGEVQQLLTAAMIAQRAHREVLVDGELRRERYLAEREWRTDEH